MQVRALSAGRSQSVPETTGTSLGMALVGQPATWVRRYLALLAAAELVVHLWGRLPGALAYSLACLLIVNHQMVRDVAWGTSAAVDREDQGHPGAAPTPIFLVLSIVALTRVASLATGDFSTTWFGGFALASIPVALALLRFFRLCGAPPTRTWGHLSWRQALVAAVAIPLALVGVLTSYPRPALDWWDLSWQLWAMAFLFAASGVLDEIFYQAIVGPSLGAVMGTSGAAGSAFLYAITHADVELGLLFAMVAANVLFGMTVRRTGLLVGACTGRALLNVLIVLVLPYWLPH